MYVKFLQETDQMISMGHNLVFRIFLDKYQLSFTLSCVRALCSRTLHIIQSLSCLWRHNDAMMIISLAWFHNLFSWDLYHFRGNWLKQIILKYYATDSPRANPCFLPLIYRGLTHFRRSYLNSWFMLFFRNHYLRWKTSTAKIYNFYSLVFLRICGSKWKYFSHFGKKISIFYASHQ